MECDQARFVLLLKLGWAHSIFVHGAHQRSIKVLSNRSARQRGGGKSQGRVYARGVSTPGAPPHQGVDTQCSQRGVWPTEFCYRSEPRLVTLQGWSLPNRGPLECDQPSFVSGTNLAWAHCRVAVCPSEFDECTHACMQARMHAYRLACVHVCL